jgi:hypothetical protein
VRRGETEGSSGGALRRRPQADTRSAGEPISGQAISVSNVSAVGRKTEDAPLVMGGSITRSPEGRLHTLQTHGQYPTPITVQEVWSFASRRRYRKDWDRQRVGDVGYTIEWEQRHIACSCGRSLGDYVAYRVCRVSGQGQRSGGAWRGGGHRAPLRVRIRADTGREAKPAVQPSLPDRPGDRWPSSEDDCALPLPGMRPDARAQPASARQARLCQPDRADVRPSVSAGAGGSARNLALYKPRVSRAA